MFSGPTPIRRIFVKLSIGKSNFTKNDSYLNPKNVLFFQNIWKIITLTRHVVMFIFLSAVKMQSVPTFLLNLENSVKSIYNYIFLQLRQFEAV